MAVVISGSTGITLPDNGALSTSIGDAINITSGYVSGIKLGGTGAANTLDDYEEGTWTPTFIGSNGNPTVNYAAQSGKYTKVGNQVTLSLYMVTNSVSGGSSSSNLRIAGLPFNSDGAAGGRFGNFQNWNTALNQSIGAFANGSYMPVFWKQNVAVTTNQLRTSGDSNQIWFDITYRCVG